MAKKISTISPGLTKRQYYLAVCLQFTYMAAIKPLKVKEKFLDSLCRNIKGLSLPEDEEETLTAVAIKAFGSQASQRQQLSCIALDALKQFLYPPKRPLAQSKQQKGEQ